MLPTSPTLPRTTFTSCSASTGTSYPHSSNTSSFAVCGMLLPGLSARPAQISMVKALRGWGGGWPRGLVRKLARCTGARNWRTSTNWRRSTLKISTPHASNDSTASHLPRNQCQRGGTCCRAATVAHAPPRYRALLVEQRNRAHKAGGGHGLGVKAGDSKQLVAGGGLASTTLLGVGLTDTS